jgi:peptidoglycan hydrolase CwlO-like protein
MLKAITLFLTLLPFTVSAHSAKDPIAELEKTTSRLESAQKSFSQLTDTQEQFDNIESQLSYMQKNILLVRNMMAKEYPHVKSGMSKYELDYIEVLDENLIKFKQSLKQMRELID